MIPFTVHRLTSDGWRRFRDIRLTMLAEEPIAYGERLSHAQSMTDDEWMTRVADYVAGSGIRVAAVDLDGDWIGTMGGHVSAADGDRPVLVAVYVAPGHRGSAAGVTDALLDAVVEWARPYGDELLLHVHEDNLRARAAYRKRGFVENGVTLPYQLDPSKVEYEMAKKL